MKLFYATIVAAWVAAVVGYLINLVDVIQLAVANSPLTTMFVVKAAGILLAPVGVICGLFF